MNNKRILLVDDEQDLTYGIALHLEHEGYQVLVAHTGLDGLKKARQEAPDLIILDLMLPQIDGHKVCRLLKFDGQYRHIPVVMLTARGRKEDEQLSYEVGADWHMTKPFEPVELSDKIRWLLGSHNAGRAEIHGPAWNGSTPKVTSRERSPRGMSKVVEDNRLEQIIE